MSRPCWSPRNRFIEALETRRLLADGEDRDLGTLVGRQYLDELVGAQENVDNFRFTLNEPAFVQAQLSRLIGLADFGISVQNEVGTDFFSSSSPGQVDELAEGNVPAVTFDVTATRQFSLAVETYRLAVAADFAPGELIGNGPDLRANVGKNLGTLSTVNAITARDFIGYLDTSEREGKDLIDTYRFTVPAFGTVRITLDQLANDVAGGSVAAEFQLYRDIDADGRLEVGESLDTRNAGVNQARVIERQLNAGDYLLVVNRLAPAVNASFGGSNYRLRMSYTVADNAGNTLATARDIGGLGGAQQTFQDYVSQGATGDTADIYKFATVGDGPFVFDARLGIGANATFNMDVLRDANGNGRLDPGEVVASTTSGAAGVEQTLTAPLTIPGTYFVRVLPTLDEGPYTLVMSARNTDVPGSTLATAVNIGDLFGRRVFTDFLSTTDTTDIFKFRVNTAGTIRASFPATAGGTNVNLQLIQDLDSDGEIDADDVLVASNTAGNAGESIARLSGRGTYFVRVVRAAGNPSYQLSLNLDAAGEGLEDAQRLAFTPTTIGRIPVDNDTIEFVGADGDFTDAYQFTVTRAIQFTVLFSLLDRRVDVSLGRDANNNDVLEDTETVLNFTSQFGSDRRSLELPTLGTYFLTVRGVDDGGTNYGIAIASAPRDRAGNTLAAARDVGILSPTVRSFTDFVGDGTIEAADDPRDFYRFALGEAGPFVFTAQLTGLTGDASLALILDRDEDNTIDANETIIARDNPGTAPEQINTVLTVRGRYFVRVQRISGNAAYTLTLTAPSTDSAGNSFGAARDLGELSGTRAQSELVGSIDPEDFFRFSVDSPGDLYAWAVPSSGDLSLQVLQDANENGEIDSGEILGSAANFGNTPELLNNIPLPAAGTYFARVFQALGDTGYNLTLRFVSVDTPQTSFNAQPFVILPTGTTTIQAEQFDNGGETISFHDTDGVNDGNAFRTDVGVDIFTTNDPGGGFRVANIRAGEFLEYSVVVAEDAFYDFRFRVASPEPGAAFHVELDNINATGAIQIPDTNSFNSFTTITKTGIPMTSGLHVIKLAFDTEAPANLRAGAINFFTLTASAVQSTTVGATADAFVRDGSNANNNFGAGNDLQIKKNATGFNREIWLKFDLSGVPSVSNARLHLFGALENNDIANVPISVFSSTDTTWQETAITFNNRPATGGTALATTTIIDATPRTYELDLTAFLQAEKAAGRNLVTLVLRANNNIPRFVTFDSREAAGENGPSLVINA